MQSQNINQTVESRKKAHCDILMVIQDSLIPNSMKNTVDPDPTHRDSDPGAVNPDPGPFQAFDP